MANRSFREVDRKETLTMKLFDHENNELENDKLPNPDDSSVLYQTSEPMLLQAVSVPGDKYRAVVHTIGTPDRREAKGVVIMATITDIAGRVFTAKSEPFDISAGPPFTANISLGSYRGPRVNAPQPQSSATGATRATPIPAPLSPGFHEAFPTNELPKSEEATVHPFAEKPKAPGGTNEQHPSLAPESTPEVNPPQRPKDGSILPPEPEDIPGREAPPFQGNPNWNK